MRIILYPFALVYGGLLWIRNYFYDKGWMKSFEFDFPVILVGNISVGGTGKTPHVEYLIKILKDEYKIATLSRGYKRKMRGYGLATELSLVEDIGDEPKLYKHKYPEVEVGVSENRVHGIYYLLNDEPDVQVVLMDDGFQHRRLKAGFNILLTKYNDLFCDDFILPAGKLREPKSGKKRAQMIIVTKCPASLNSAEKDNITQKIGLKNDQKIFFTTQIYGNLYPLFQEQTITKFESTYDIILLSGIASNKDLITHLSAGGKTIRPISFPDHHYFTDDNIHFVKLKSSSNSIIITTEKDAMRLMEKEDKILEEKLSIFVLPIEINFLFENENFTSIIKNYINQYEKIGNE